MTGRKLLVAFHQILTCPLLLCLWFSLFIMKVQANANVFYCESAFSDLRNAEILSSRLLRGVVELSDSQKISQGIYAEFEVNQIAHAVVERIRRQEVDFEGELFKTGVHKPIDLEGASDIILFFKPNDLKSIKEHGFLNVHQVKKSNGIGDLDLRLRAENGFTGIDLGDSKHTVKHRPKSAFLNIREATDLGNKINSMTLQYGTVGAVLKSAIKERTIWTAMDSLPLGLAKIVPPTDLSGKSLLQSRGTFSRRTLPVVDQIDYYEALIYGSLDLSDVDYFLVSKPTKLNNWGNVFTTSDVVDPSVVDLLRPIGIPIYSTEPIVRNRRIIFEKGAILFDGNH